MIRRIMDYIQLVSMTNSKLEDVRDMSRHAVKRHGWNIRPCSGRKWFESITFTDLAGGTLGLWYNDAKGSTHVVRWTRSIGVLVGDGSQQAADTAKAIRGKK